MISHIYHRTDIINLKKERYRLINEQFNQLDTSLSIDERIEALLYKVKNEDFISLSTKIVTAVVDRIRSTN
jgi:hypothetical protein